jgi:hypothetical protein
MLLVALASVTCLGFGSALVLAGSKQNGTPPTGQIFFCQAIGPKDNPSFQPHTDDASAVVDTRSNTAKHPDDIIPPFNYIVTGSTTPVFFPGQNMTTTYNGYTGAQLLANNCVIGTPTVSTSVSTGTTTEPTSTTETEPVPPSTVTVTGTTLTQTVTVTVTLPANTVTAPGSTTVVTDPPGPPTTVTIPGQTVTLPVSTDMKTTVVTVTTPSHVITVPGHLISHVEGAKAVIKTIIKRTLERVFTPLIRACHAASGTGKG